MVDPFLRMIASGCILARSGPRGTGGLAVFGGGQGCRACVAGRRWALGRIERSAIRRLRRQVKENPPRDLMMRQCEIRVLRRLAGCWVCAADRGMWGECRDSLGKMAGGLRNRHRENLRC